MLHHHTLYKCTGRQREREREREYSIDACGIPGSPYQIDVDIDLDRQIATGGSRIHEGMANLRTKIMDFRGFDPSIILMLRGGILMSTWNSPEMLSQGILIGILLVGRLGVWEMGGGLRLPTASSQGAKQPADAESRRLPACTLAASFWPGCLAAWLSCLPSLQLPGCPAAWLPGCPAAQLPGCPAARLPGCFCAGPRWVHSAFSAKLRMAPPDARHRYYH